MSDVDYVKRESEDVLNADHFESEESEWQVQKELALLNAISKCKPVGKLPENQFCSLSACMWLTHSSGMHKHFRIISIQRQYNQDNPTPLTIEEIWRELEHLYGIEALNELVTTRCFKPLPFVRCEDHETTYLIIIISVCRKKRMRRMIWIWTSQVEASLHCLWMITSN
jgi:hypothetical protein